MKKIITFILLLSCSSSIFVMDESQAKQQELTNSFRRLRLKIAELNNRSEQLSIDSELNNHSEQLPIESDNHSAAIQKLGEQSSQLLSESKKFEESAQNKRLQASKDKAILTSLITYLDSTLLYFNSTNK